MDSITKRSEVFAGRVSVRPIIVVYDKTIEQARHLSTRINQVFEEEGRLGEAIPSAPNSAIVASRGVTKLPAVLLVRTWTDLDILLEGRAPSTDLIREWSRKFRLNAELMAYLEERRQRLEEQRRDAPKSLDEAVSRLLDTLSDEDKQTLRGMPQDDLYRMHHTWGMGIRNAWLFDNPDLLSSCGTDWHEEASMKIMIGVWRRLVDRRGI